MHIKKFYSFLVVFLLSLATQAFAQVNDLVGAVVFEGVSVFATEDFLPLYVDNLGEPLTIEAAEQLQEDIGSMYTELRFLPPRVELSDHPDAPELLLVQVSEPRISQVQLRLGEGGSGVPGIQEQAQKITEYQAVAWQDIDLLVRDLEHSLGLTLDSSVHRIDGDGAEYYLVLELATDISGQVTYSAEGSERLGRHMVGGHLNVDNPFVGVSRIYLSALQTLESASGYRNLGAGVVVPVSSRDRLYLDASLARAVPQDGNAGPASVYRRQWSRLKWIHQLVDRREVETSVSGALTVRNYTREAEDVKGVDERLRMASAGVQTTLRDRGRASRLWANGRVGVDALGAQREGPQAYGDIDMSFQLLEAGYTVWQVLPADFSLRLDTAGQYSRDNVPYSQRFSFGGSRFARAYEPGEFSGDTGAGAKLELRRGFDTDLLTQARLVPYTYYGIATTYQNAYERSYSGASAGVGLRVLADVFSAYLEFGKPLTVASEYQEDDPRMAGRLNLEF